MLRQPGGTLQALDPLEDDRALLAERASAAARCTWVSVGVNLGLSATQMLAGVLSGSQGLVADALHSLSDLLSDVVVLFANHHSRKDADQDHPYGHQRFETGASLALGMLLLFVGVGLLGSAVGKLGTSGAVRTVSAIALWVVAIAIIAKELLFRYMMHVAKRYKSSLLAANAWHARSDALSTLVVGIGVIGNRWGYPVLDPIAALLVGLMICRMGWKFGWNALNDLMDRAADESEVEAIRETLLATAGIRGVHDLRTRKMGDMIVVDVHLDIDGTLSVAAGHDIASAAKREVLKHHRVLDVFTHVDPWFGASTSAAGR